MGSWVLDDEMLNAGMLADWGLAGSLSFKVLLTVESCPGMVVLAASDEMPDSKLWEG